MLTQERLNELLCYNAETGRFTRKTTKGGKKKGSVAGSLKKCGCIHIKIDNRMYLAHRLVFLLEDGEFPPNLVDHKDGDRENNKRTNLRKATDTQNNQNSSVSRNNLLGIKGVGFHKTSGKYVAQMSINGKQTHLGLYETPELASAVVTAARIKYHGEFARHA